MTEKQTAKDWQLEEFHKLHVHLDMMEIQMSAFTDELKAEVAKNRDVTRSAVALIRGLVEKLQTAVSNGDLTEAQAALDEIKADSAELGAAVTENTPADPTPQP